MILDVIPFVHWFLSANIQLGDTVVDATMGNGHDTLLLSQLVGKKGNVFSFDIQEKALENTKILLEKYQVQNVQLILDNHIHFGEYLKQASAFVYNLGYLPKGDKSITTRADDTLLSIQKAMQLLSSNGIIAIVLYPGHPSGYEEKTVLEEYLATVSQADFEVVRYQFINHQKNAPYTILLQNKK